MKINLKPLVIVLIAAVSIFVPYSSVAMDNGGMDIVLIMDSSGSMKKTDPLSLRIPAAKLFISLMGEDDRAGVISFSDTGYPIIYLTPVTSEEKMDEITGAVEKISSSGLYTNLYAALKKGYDVLSADKRAESRQIMILMSDGMMDTGNPDEDRRLVNKTEDELAVMLKNEGIKVYTIAFTDQSDRKLLEKISKKTGGFYNLALTDKDFHLIFTSIFESLKSPDMLPMSENGFLIDSSVEEVTIVASKDSPETRIQLIAPDSQKYSFKNRPPGSKWFESDNFEMITVKNPSEGRWEILFSAGKNNKAYIITNLRLMSNFDESYTIYGDPLDIGIWLEKEGTRIKEMDVLDMIDIYIELSRPDGETIKLKPFNKGEGTFYRRVAPFSPGNYTLRIIADGKTFEREKSFVFNVADLNESKKVVEAKQSVENEKEASEQKDPEDEKGDEKINEQEEEKSVAISWGKVITKFLLINLLFGIAVFIYIKRKRLKCCINLSKIKCLIPGKKGGKKKRHKREEKPEAGEGPEKEANPKESKKPEQETVPEQEGEKSDREHAGEQTEQQEGGKSLPETAAKERDAETEGQIQERPQEEQEEKTGPEGVVQQADAGDQDVDRESVALPEEQEEDAKEMNREQSEGIENDQG